MQSNVTVAQDRISVDKYSLHTLRLLQKAPFPTEGDDDLRRDLEVEAGPVTDTD